MLYAYVLENTDKITRNNQALFKVITEFDIGDDYTFIDKDNDENRPELKMLLGAIQPKSKLVVRSVTDLADTFLRLHSVFQRLIEKRVTLVSCEELFLCGEIYADILVGFSKLYITYEKKKQEQGYKRALEQGTVGRPKKTKEVELAIKLYKSGLFKVSQIEVMTGISKSTLYRYLKDEKCDNSADKN